MWPLQYFQFSNFNMLRAALLDAVRCFPFESFCSYNSLNNRLFTLIWYCNFRTFFGNSIWKTLFSISFRTHYQVKTKKPSIAMQAPSTRVILKFQSNTLGPKSISSSIVCFVSTPRQTLCLSYYKENLPEPANLVNLIANWDVLKIQNRFRDAAGCLLSYDEDVIAGPNSLCFIKRSTDHVNTTHPFTVESEKSKALKEKEKALSKSISSCNTIAVDTSKQASSNQTIITGKYAKKLKFRPIGSFMNSKLKLSEPCKDDMDRFGKGFCISIVHSGVNSCLSNNVILENLQTSLNSLLTFWVSIFAFLLAVIYLEIKTISLSALFHYTSNQSTCLNCVNKS